MAKSAAIEALFDAGSHHAVPIGILPAFGRGHAAKASVPSAKAIAAILGHHHAATASEAPHIAAV